MGWPDRTFHQLNIGYPDLSVVSRNATFAFKNQILIRRDMPPQLNVTHIFEGSVRQS